MDWWPESLGITPFGAYCKLCPGKRLPITKALFDHISSEHGFSPCVSRRLFIEKVEEEIKKLRRTNEKTAEFLLPDGRSGMRFFCRECFLTFPRKQNFRRHVEKCIPRGSTEICPVLCGETLCGNWGPRIEDSPTSQGGGPSGNMPVQEISLTPQESVSETGTGVTSSSSLPTSQHFEAFQVPVPDNLLLGEARAAEILAPFVRSEDCAEDLTSIFLPLLGLYPTTFGEVVTREVGWTMSEPAADEHALQMLLEAGEKWLFNHARLHVMSVPADIRARMINFDSPENEDTSTSSVFVLRKDLNRLWKELSPLLKYLMRCESQLILEIKQELGGRRREEVQNMEGFLGKVFLRLGLETTPDLSTLPVLARYCLIRCFAVKDGRLNMVDCGWAGSRLSTVLHLLRAGVCLFITGMRCDTVTLEANKLAGMIQHGRATNHICPYISRLRHIHSRKPAAKNNTINGNGDITSCQFFFPRSKWSVLIPTIIKLASEYLSKIFIGDGWKKFIEPRTRVVVRDWYSLDIMVEDDSDGSRTTLSSLIVRMGPMMEKKLLQGMIEFCFHGAGCGSARYEEVRRLQLSATQYHNGFVYFWTESIKTGSLASMKKRKHAKLTEHRLSLSLSRLVMLYRYVSFPENEDLDDNLERGRRILPTSLLFSKEDERHMMTAVGHIFGFFTLATALQIRHFWASVTNYVFPSKEGRKGGGVVAESGIAEMSGHSSNTHAAAYASECEGWREMVYDKFHTAIGEEELQPKTVRAGYSEEQILHGLRILLGQDAQLRRGQENLCWHTCNSWLRHGFGYLRCGTGKSMSWLLPTVSDRMAGTRVGMRIVVFPYRFLLRHMMASIDKSILSMGISVACYDKSMVTETDLPDEMFREDYPKIVYMTTDAFSVALRHHMPRIVQLWKRGVLARIYVDEVQQLLGEWAFRNSYEAYRNLGAIGCPVTLLSGSMGTKLGKTISTFLGLCCRENYKAEMDVVETNDPVGAGFDFDIYQVGNEVECAIKETRKRKSLTGGDVHLICASSVVAKEIQQAMELKGMPSVVVTSKNTSDEQRDIALRWYRGDIAVLVSTTVALVGNENARCRSIIVVGMLFNLSSIIQAVGRLRPSQRGDTSSLTILRRRIMREEAVRWQEDDKENYVRLLSAGVLTTDDRHSYWDLFSMNRVVTFVQKKEGCLIQWLRKYAGADLGPVCNRCTLCRREESNRVVEEAAGEKSIKVAHVAATPSVVEGVSIRDNRRKAALAVISQLEFRCPNCKISWCSGEKCLKGCFKCGEKSHLSSRCTFDCRKVLEGKGCFFCYDLTDRVGVHSAGECPLQRRLRVLYFLAHKKQQKFSRFSEYFAWVHSSQDNFYCMVTGAGVEDIPGQISVKTKRIKKVLHATQVSDEDEKAPLLPPNFCRSRDQATNKDYIRERVYTDVNRARAAYNSLRTGKLSCNRRRGFVYGFVYSKLFRGYLLLKPKEMDTDLVIKCASGNESTVKIRLVEDGRLLQHLCKLGSRMPTEGNARKQSGDFGEMYGVGVRDSTSKSVYVTTNGREEEMKRASVAAREWLEEELPEIVQDICEVSKQKGQKNEKWMPNGPGNSMMISKNLGNSSHYDLDSSMSVSIWVEERPGRAAHWYFVLPNVSCDGSLGVVIQICHGATVSWDGRLIRHCTSRTVTGIQNNVYGLMFGSVR